MPKSLADLRKSPHVGRPVTEFPLCIAGKLNAEFDRIDVELDRLTAGQPAAPADPDAPQPPGRMGRKGIDPKTRLRLQELNARREELRAEMAEHTVVLTIEALEDGRWRDWINAHPPREDNQADHRAGFDVDALIDLIRTEPRTFIKAINGEGYTDEDWAFVWGNASEGDQLRVTASVRGLHQSGVDVPKSLSGWLETRMS